jgi:cell cycle arrest protein BUB2
MPFTNAPARPLIWKLLLDVRSLEASTYLSLLAKGPSPMHDKIRNDAFRTLATDQNFKARVNETTLIRVLDAFVWRYWCK